VPYQTNFDTTLQLHPLHLRVAGNTDGILPSDQDPVEGSTLIARTVTIIQGDSVASRGVTSALNKWDDKVPLAGATFTPGPGTANGREVYALAPSVNPGAVSTTVTVDWVQAVTIEGAP